MSHLERTALDTGERAFREPEGSPLAVTGSAAERETGYFTKR